VRRALEALEPLMEADSLRLFRALGGRPATVRLFDPVPNEFLPRDPDDVERLAAFLGIRPAELARRVERRFEINPMLGNRGVRLVMVAPEIARAQARAILRGAARAARQGVPVRPEIEIPLVIHETEVRVVAAAVRQVAAEVSRESGLDLPCRVGVMVETPAAVRAADAYARDIDFIWFGMNDLTQTVLALSRDDTGRLVPVYESAGIFAADPFKSLDRVVATFVSECVLRARAANPDIRVGAAGDLGGDPYSVEAFHRIGLDMVSASTWLIPVTLLASAQANLRYPRRR
jgi:pyruvate,orthophosphate dikinase